MNERDYLFAPDWPPPPPNGGGGGNSSPNSLTEWGQLAAGKTLGKSLIVQYDSAIPLATPQGNNMFMVQGDDNNALQLSVLLSPPKFFPGTFNGDVDPTNTIDNQQMLDQSIQKRLACPVAIIEWGIGGVSNEAVVDINNGLLVNLSASFVRIRAAIETPQALTNSLSYNIGAFIGPGRPKGINAQKTVNFSSVAAGVISPMAALPKFAKRAYVVGQQAAGGVFACDLVYFRDQNGLTSICRQFFAGNSPAPLPIPNGAYFFGIQPQAETVVSVIFELAI